MLRRFSLWALAMTAVIGLATNVLATDQQPASSTQVKSRRMQRVIVSPTADRGLRRALMQPVNLHFDAAPLSKVMEHISTVHGINGVLDVNGLEQEGIRTDVPMTIHVDGVSLKTALTVILEPLNLGARMENRVVMITGQRRLGETMLEKADSAAVLDSSPASRGKAPFGAGAIRGYVPAAERLRLGR